MTMLIVPSARPRRTSAASLAATMRDSCATLHRQAGEALGEGAVMLAGEQRGRHHHRDLRARHGGDEGGAQRHLGLAEADIAADQPVHRPAGGQILQHVGDGARLVLGLGEREAGAELVPARLRPAPCIAASRILRAAAMRISSPAMSRMRCFIRALRDCQATPPSLSSATPCALAAEARQHLDVLDRQEQLVVAVVDQAQAVVRRAGDRQRRPARRSGRCRIPGARPGRPRRFRWPRR